MENGDVEGGVWTVHSFAFNLEAEEEAPMPGRDFVDRVQQLVRRSILSNSTTVGQITFRTQFLERTRNTKVSLRYGRCQEVTGLPRPLFWVLHSFSRVAQQKVPAFRTYRDVVLSKTEQTKAWKRNSKTFLIFRYLYHGWVYNLSVAL